MSRRDPLLPNAAIVARREYRDRVRSPLFLVSTVILMGLALAVAVTPIAIRYLDRQRVDVGACRVVWRYAQGDAFDRVLQPKVGLDRAVVQIAADARALVHVQRELLEALLPVRVRIEGRGAVVHHEQLAARALDRLPDGVIANDAAAARSCHSAERKRPVAT